MGFLESFTQLLGAAYDVVASFFEEKPPTEPTREDAPRPTLDDEERKKPEARPTPTGYASNNWFRGETFEWQSGEDSAENGSYSEPQLLFGEIQVGVWNRWAIPRCLGAHVSVYGCRGSEEIVWRTGFPYPDKDQQGLWFHGTDYESALSIVRDGIDLHRGKGHQDFSHRDGFYLSLDFHNARRWACSGKRERPAVIVFKIRLRSRQGLNLKCRKSDWEDIIKFNRSGREFVPAAYVSRDALIKLHNCDYMIGPINGGRDGPKSKDGDWQNWTPSGFDRPFQQLCVRSEAMARDLGDGNNIESVIFY